ncbi:MAG: peptidase S8 [Gammaproteobacteria bacterium]|nr:MAG: peptidase S8 [Gammaproteobacteria bacterium]
MAQQYKHLLIEKEVLSNPRRTVKRNPPRANPGDLRRHAQHLGNALAQAVDTSRQQLSAETGAFVFKLKYSGMLDLKNLYKHGVEFISQEDSELCIVFADEQGLATFAEHLALLGVDDTNLSYKQILEAINGIDNWTAEDRKSWAVRHKGFPLTPSYKIDIELWPVETTYHPKREQLLFNFKQWLEQSQIAEIDHINLDSLLMFRLEVTAEQTEQLLNLREVRQVDLPPATGISYEQLNVPIESVPNNISSPAPEAARVCILDSGINTNHPLLKTAIAESQSYIADQEVDDESGHGTAVAGIALYGDVEACVAANFWHPQFWLYNGKVMYLDQQAGETRFDDKTIASTLSEAVEYFAGELGCRIFNVSLGNANAPYDGRHIRGIAYVLDKLAREYDALFIVSAGNFNGSDNPPVPQTSWRDEYPHYLMDEASVIIDPATALNVITVGSLARHNAHVNEQRHPEISALSPASEDQPSPFTRHGPSVNKALKPDLMATGGNRASPLRQEGKQWKNEERGMGVLTLNHQFVGGTLLNETSGTSFAAPYITHLAGRLLNEYPQASANILRAMLVNHANLPDQCVTAFDEGWRTNYKEAKGTKHRELPCEVAGYGKVDEEALYRSSDNVVVLMAEESIENNAHQFFELPLPESYLRSERSLREVRVTLAYTPPVRTTRLDYIATKISYKLVKATSLVDVEQRFNHDTQQETASMKDHAGGRTITADTRSRGTVQSSVWQFKRGNPEQKWFVVVTRQDKDWGGLSPCLDLEPYALVVTVADQENQQAQLYNEIQLRIQAQARIRARIGQVG